MNKRLMASVLCIGAFTSQLHAINWPQISLSNYVSGLSSPVDIQNAGDGSDRLFIVQRGGSIRIVTNGTLVSTPFLNISGVLTSSGGEQGLLGLAFPPDFGTSTNPHFYVYYTRASDGDNVVARYYVSATNMNIAETNSAEVLLTVNDTRANHNGGQLAFNPFDNYLYVALGDGGGGGDPDDNGQDPTELLGKILRLDVEPPNGTNYTIPPDNPYVGSTTNKQEIWALGLRNPWRFCFDPLNGDMFIGDVGQNAFEEISYQAGGTAGGTNFGWNCKEGLHDYDTTGCDTSVLTAPIYEYAQSPGCSVTGGKVYRGVYYSYMYGVYFYSDYCHGDIYGLQYSDGVWTNHLFTNTSLNVVSFGVDESNNLYVAHLGGTIYKIVETFTDADSDEMYDAWETYYGLDTNDSSDASADLDGDGMANVDEFFAGTEPSDSNDVFQMQSPVSTNEAIENFVLQWTSESNKSYIVEKGTNLLEGFSDFITNLATPPVNTYTDDVSEDIKFYRIRLEP